MIECNQPASLTIARAKSNRAERPLEESTMTAQLSELSTLASQLNKQAYRWNEELRRVNDELAKMHIGIEVWLDSWRREPMTAGKFYKDTQFGFAKTEGTWQLSIRDVTIESGTSHRISDVGKAQPLLKASREKRREGFILIERITDELKKRMREFLNP